MIARGGHRAPSDAGAWRRHLAVWLAALLALAAPAAAHPAVATAALVRVERTGQFEITLIHDVLALALADSPQNIPDAPMLDLLAGPPAELEHALVDAARRFERLVVLEADGARVPLTVIARPTLAEVLEQRSRRPAYPLPIKLELTARATLPPDARRWSLRFPDLLGPVVLTVQTAGQEPVSLPLGVAERSPDFAIDREPGAPVPPGGPAWWSVAARFAALGFTHIIPAGADHALFVLGLFLLVPRARPVVIQISAFTVAHTVTLTLTALSIVRLSPSIVESAIAASILFVGIENLLIRRISPWRVVVAFIFGLVHGMGVASSFREAGFPPGQLISSLAAFTVGVEAGHLSILAAAFLLLGWTRARAWYRPRIALPLSVLISLIAAYWLVTRLAA